MALLLQVGTTAHHRLYQSRVVLLDSHMNCTQRRAADSFLRQRKVLEAVRLEEVIYSFLGCSDLLLFLCMFLTCRRRLLLQTQGLDSLSLGLFLLRLLASDLCLLASLLFLCLPALLLCLQSLLLRLQSFLLCLQSLFFQLLLTKTPLLSFLAQLLLTLLLLHPPRLLIFAGFLLMCELPLLHSIGRTFEQSRVHLHSISHGICGSAKLALAGCLAHGGTMPNQRCRNRNSFNQN